MMYKLTVLILWFFSIVKTALFHTYFWQLKEYRLDRIIPHLKLKTGQRMIFSFLSLTKWSLILLFLAPIEIKILLPFFVSGVFLIELFVFFKSVFLRELYHPKFTLRAIGIILGTLLLVILGVVLLLARDIDLWVFVLALLCLERSTVVIVFSQVFLSKPVVFIGKEIKIRRAKRKLGESKNLKIIGVTGSYGKTSTKDFIAQVLAKKYKVAKTQGTNNTKIGIAQNILREVRGDTQIFVVEMGAYKKGEIADICRLVRPNISVVTGINEQHLAIFGSLKNLIEAKYEIVEALPGDGVAIFNGGNGGCLKMAKKASRKFRTIFFWVKKVKQGKEGMAFIAGFNGQQLSLKINLSGRHNAVNISAAVAVAKQLGLKDSQISQAVAHLSPASRMRETRGINNVLFIDDTFSSNPHGFLAALDYLKRFKSKTKIVITSGMIELGSAGGRIHKRIGQAMQKTIDLVILTNSNFLAEVREGMGSERTKMVVETQPSKIAEAILARSPNVVVLLEGRLPAKIMKTLEIK